MEKQKPRDRMFRMLLCLSAACLFGAALLLLFQNRRAAPVFAEFSESDVLTGKTDCYLNELTVLDRYAENEENGVKSQLLLASYAARNDEPVVLSLLVEQGDPLYERLLPYYSEQGISSMLSVSGYFFTSRLANEGKEAESAFRYDMQAFAEWYAEQSGQSADAREIVLTFAGETEEAYHEAIRERTVWMRITAAVLAALGVLCAVLIPIRSAAKRKRQNA